MAHDSDKLQLQYAGSRVQRHRRPNDRRPAGATQRRLTLADSADILEAALARNAERGRTILASDATRPSSNLALLSTATAVIGGELPDSKEQVAPTGDGHALLLWHSAC